MNLWEFSLVWLLTAVTPGPTAMLMLAQGLRGGMRGAVIGLLGIESGHVLLLSTLALGLSASLSAFSSALPWIQRLGALYLLFVSGRLLWIAWRPGPQRPPVEARGHFYLQALLTHLSNPNAILFTFAVIPGFLMSGEPVAPQIALLALIIIPMDFAIMAGYAWMGSRGAMLMKNRMRIVEGLAGLVIGWVALKLLLS